ncbi:MAG: DUF5671 domain-containing protein [Dehalococcoidia bacterium]
MLTIRRVYLYLVAAVSLTMLAGGIIALARTLLTLVTGSSAFGEGLREDIALSSGVSLVALPVWLLHWGLAQRFCRLEPGERTAALRRLYLYATLAVGAIAAAIAVSDEVIALVGLVVGGRGLSISNFLDSVPLFLVAAAVWGYHWMVVSRERLSDGEHGASATLRRWYVYGSAFWGLVVLLAATAGLIEFVWRLVLGPPSFGVGLLLADLAGPAIAGLVVWLFHWTWSTSGPTAEDDRRSVLRPVFMLGALAVAISVTLLQVGQVLYYLLSRVLGVPSPGGQTGSIPQLLGGPIAAAIAYGVAWIYYRRAVRRETAGDTAETRRTGVLRLYRYLVALVSLAILSVGVAGVLWTLGDLLTSATRRGGMVWEEQISLFATLAIVGLPVWLAFWRARPAASEAASLSRRLYVYLALIGAVLSALIAGASMLYQILALALDARQPNETIVNVVRALSVVVVGLGVAAYHWRALRTDAATMAAEPVAPAGPALATLRLLGPDGKTRRELSANLDALDAAFDRLSNEIASAGRMASSDTGVSSEG